MTKIKVDNEKNLVEVEGEENFAKNFVKEQSEIWNKIEQKNKDIRSEISNILLAIIVLLLFFLFTKMPTLIPIIDNGITWNFTLGFIAGLIGLFVRNLIFLSNGMKEKSGKNLYIAYLAYFIFLVFSSLLIFGFLYEKTTSDTPSLFFLIPLNFFVGMMTYSVIDIILSKLSINK